MESSSIMHLPDTANANKDKTYRRTQVGKELPVVILQQPHILQQRLQ